MSKKIENFVTQQIYSSTSTSSKYQFLKHLRTVWPSLTCAESILKNRNHYGNINGTLLNNEVAIIYGRHGPSFMEKKMDDSYTPSMILPLRGSAKIEESEKKMAYSIERGIFLDGADASSQTTEVDAIAIGFNPISLKKMLRHFSGDKNIDFSKFDSRPIDFNKAGLKDLRDNFFRSLNAAGYFGFFDEVTADMILRHCATILLMNNGFEFDKRMYLSNPKIIDRVCSAMFSNLSNPWTMTELESFSGLSARTLQKEFKKRFNLSPFTWLNEQRLLKAKSLLSDKCSGKSVSEICRECGFTHLGRFSVGFKEKFGKSPNFYRKKS